MPTASDGEGLRGQAVEPLARGHRLVGVGVVAEPAPVALALDRLVGDRALDDEHERLQLAAVGLEEPLDEVVGAADRAALEVDQRPVDGDLRQARAAPEGDLLDARLRRRRQRDRVAVAAQAGVDPQDVDDGSRQVGLRSTRHSLASQVFGGRDSGPRAMRRPLPTLGGGDLAMSAVLHSVDRPRGRVVQWPPCRPVRRDRRGSASGSGAATGPGT